MVEVAELDFVLEPTPWPFSKTHASSIAAHWKELSEAKPALYNGRILLMGRRSLVRRAEGTLRLEGAFFETDYADYVAWRAFGHPGERVDNRFSMAALRTAEGAFLLGEMAPHTFNGGQIYFPAGTPDPSDVFGRRVDLEASARRELFEETGVSDEEAAIGRSWTVIFDAQRVACMKPMTLALTADAAKTRIDAFLALDPEPEFSRMHIVRSPDDIDEARTPAFVAAYLRAAFDTAACAAGSG
jgi:8-oxo-dGTP pyrophosphatase MutT (NUDIX family)